MFKKTTLSRDLASEQTTNGQDPSSALARSTSVASKASSKSKKSQAMATQASASPMPAGVTDPNYVPPPGHLGNLTVTQLHCLDKLKKELKELGIFDESRMDDATLLRCVDAVSCAFYHPHLIIRVSITPGSAEHGSLTMKLSRRCS